MNSFLRISSYIFFVLVIFLYCYLFYKSHVVYNGERNYYYFKYYFFLSFFLLSAILYFFLNSKHKINFILIYFSIFFSLYIIEAYLIFNQNIVKNKLIELKKIKISEKIFNYDKRTEYQIFLDEQKKDASVRPYISSAAVGINIEKNFFPLSSISNVRTILCNENGYYPIYRSDRYGFNNPDSEWNNNVEYLIIGDSFAHGSCVNQKDTVSGKIRFYKNTSALNLGHGGNGPLIEYATLREYINLINPKYIIWMYYEANDLENLKQELKNEILLKYLLDDKFSQNLIEKQNDIDIYLNSIFQNNLTKEAKLNQNDNKFTFNIKHFITLVQIRNLTLEKYFTSIDPNFKKILRYSKDLSIKNNAKLYFLYVPEYSRFKKGFSLQNSSRLYKKVIEITDELEIDLIDLNKILSDKKNTINFFPLDGGHFNENGYDFVSKVIINETQND